MKSSWDRVRPLNHTSAYICWPVVSAAQFLHIFKCALPYHSCQGKYTDRRGIAWWFGKVHRAVICRWNKQQQNISNSKSNYTHLKTRALERPVSWLCLTATASKSGWPPKYILSFFNASLFWFIANPLGNYQEAAKIHLAAMATRKAFQPTSCAHSARHY